MQLTMVPSWPCSKASVCICALLHGAEYIHPEEICTSGPNSMRRWWGGFFCIMFLKLDAVSLNLVFHRSFFPPPVSCVYTRKPSILPWQTKHVLSWDQRMKECCLRITQRPSVSYNHWQTVRTGMKASCQTLQSCRLQCSCGSRRTQILMVNVGESDKGHGGWTLHTPGLLPLRSRFVIVWEVQK